MDILPFDLQRMLLGDEPPLFLFEIAVRTFIVYAYTLLLLRWLGSRAIGQLSTVEFLLVIALGSAVGDAMFYPDVPLLHALLVVTAVVLANKAIDVLIARSKRAERVIDGTPEEAVRNGVVCKKFIGSSTLSTSELYQQLREHGVRQLGEVEHAFVETDGVVTVFKRRGDVPLGLPIVPPWEIEAPAAVPVTERRAIACTTCGTLHPGDGSPRCEHCGHERWTLATGDDPEEHQVAP